MKDLLEISCGLDVHKDQFLKILMNHYDSWKEHLNEIEKALNQDMEPFSLQVEQLNSIYGISTIASCASIAEIGVDMNPFKTAEHICSWAGLCPGKNESAGKRNPYLSAWYWRIKQKKGAKKAIVALARKLLVIIYTMLKQGTVFDKSYFEVNWRNMVII